MAKGYMDLSILSDIANAIRYVNGLSTKYKPSEMENAIRASKKTLGQKTITSNGTYTPRTDNYDGYSEVIVNVDSGGSPVLVSKSITQNGNYNPTDDNADGYNSVSVNVQPNLQQKTATQNGEISADSGYDGLSSVVVNVSGGGGSEELADVIFYDYDGTVLYSYTASEFAELSSFPADPTHPGLTSDGWNWTLSDAQAYVASYGKLDIGHMYSTSDGKTHIKIHLSQGYTSPILCLCVDGEVDVDWGDNTAHSTLTGSSTTELQSTEKHQYAAPGEYEILLDVSSYSEIDFEYGNSSSLLLRSESGDYTSDLEYRKAITEINVGERVDLIGNRAFFDCLNLSKISLPYGIGSFYFSTFERCQKLKCVIIPASTALLMSRAFSRCMELKSISIPKSVTTTGDRLFHDCSSLKRVCLPSGISLYSLMFECCHDLEDVIIPSGITQIPSYCFMGCSSLTKIQLPQSITSISQYAFNGCVRLTDINLPSGITKIESYTFFTCSKLKQITIPNTVTKIENYAFGRCHSLPKITIPSSVTDLGNNILNSCYNLSEIHFQGTTPPTATSTTFSSIPAGYVIFVPTGSLSAYTSAANYPSSATYTYIEE